MRAIRTRIVMTAEMKKFLLWDKYVSFAENFVVLRRLRYPVVNAMMNNE